ncbi:SDR family oxidoreductase [Rhizobium sp. RM]|uniref:SDR family oxidoreductase n=1 Tax=Rhizobium sp. RM TaxID=2748079 RepID=UPI00110F548E|nr:SDR family oxidoreductase [Rhizobium sp. RM]NWJ24059.1 SDR family oxidoreductase [Rhizobium sp. RM]TMV21370.1 SDR family oxidoreductase [Rhizobium sp. Td3]
MNRLANKTALITGGTSGIGLETAKQFIAEGARVAITGTNPKTMEAARSELGDDVLIIRADASDVAAQKTVASEIEKAFGKLDIVFVNAGVADLRPIENWDEAGFERTFDINVKGPFFLIQALLPLLSNPASIVLNTSVNAHVGMPTSSVYGASKAALLSMARTLSGELIGRGIRINAVSPGPITTPLYGKLGLSEEGTKAMAAGVLAQVPAGRFGTPSEVAKAVVFLASDEASFTVGAELMMDGGMGTL